MHPGVVPCQGFAKLQLLGFADEFLECFSIDCLQPLVDHCSCFRAQAIPAGHRFQDPGLILFSGCGIEVSLCAGQPGADERSRFIAQAGWLDHRICLCYLSGPGCRDSCRHCLCCRRLLYGRCLWGFHLTGCACQCQTGFPVCVAGCRCCNSVSLPVSKAGSSGCPSERDGVALSSPEGRTSLSSVPDPDCGFSPDVSAGRVSASTVSSLEPEEFFPPSASGPE